MFERKSLRFPITLGVTMIVLLVALIIGWILLTVVNALRDPYSSLNWAFLAIGTPILAFILVGVVLYLTLTIKAINLNQRQSNFIDSVTHELKTPVASLKLYLQTISRRQVTDEEHLKFHEFMMDDVERLDHLISHMLEAGAIDKPKDDSELMDVELSQLIADVAESVCVRYRVDPSIIQLDLKPFLIRSRHPDVEMIFRNLIDNAVKYAGTPPRVSVSMTLYEDLAIIQIADNGPGIPREDHRAIFGRFVRLGKELERSKPGTGLGLYIVRTLVKKLGGKVRVVERLKKSGTVFEVQLTGRRKPVQKRIEPAGSRESTTTGPNQP
jgi:signal transduction histidine kinase